MCLYICAHTHKKKFICLPAWIILLSYDPQSLKGKMMVTPYKTVFQRVQFAFSEGQEWDTYPEWEGRSHTSSKRMSMPNPLKAMKSSHYPNIHIIQGSSGAKMRDRQEQPQRQRWSLWAPAHPLQPAGGFCILLTVPHTEQVPLQVTSPSCFALFMFAHSGMSTHMLTQGHISLIFSFVATLHTR